MTTRPLSGSLLLTTLLASPAVHAQSLTTTYAGGNSLTSLAMNMFDITLNTATFITAFDVNCENTRSGPIGSPFTIDVWVTQLGGTYVGNELNAAAWTKVSTGSSISRAMGTPTPVDVDDFPLLPGKYGMALEYMGTAMAYTNGTGSNQMYSNNDIRLDLGASTATRFSGAIFTPRVWNGTVYYFVGNATWRTLGDGCRGSAGTPSLAPAMNSVPKLGTVFGLGIGSLPTTPTVTLLATGFSKKSWQAISLPFDLTGVGAPGCSLYTSITVLLVAVSSNGVANYSIPIPNDTQLVRAQAFFQGLVVDMPANPLGLVLSSAIEGYIGN